ncbi:hypothetical protein ACRJ4W_30080 [Streptomyces sp. GLT-R25]
MVACRSSGVYRPRGGADANGIPGQTTLKRLGKEHGFTVKA